MAITGMFTHTAHAPPGSAIENRSVMNEHPGIVFRPGRPGGGLG
jgi:hypothetical protein